MLNKAYSLKHFVYLVGLHIYYKMIHGPDNVKLILIEYFKHAAHSPFFPPSRCCLFHNAIFFYSCNIYILNTECPKILKKIPELKC